MRWTLVDGKLAAENGELIEEGQSIEFKPSLGSARRQEGIQTLVAFANADGGKVFFGVEDDGTVKGVQVGKKTLEDLANEISRHTYPSLPAHVEQFDFNGTKVVIAEAAKDTPPIVGVYLYSSGAIPPDQPVDGSKLQAFRRVGRTNQKEDFMRLRQPQPSDPAVQVALHPTEKRGASFPSTFSADIWIEESSPPAHEVEFRVDPAVCRCPLSLADLPLADGRGRLGNPLRANFDCVVATEEAPLSVLLVARYKDDWGTTWESSRRLKRYGDPPKVGLANGGEFRRRIVIFSPKGL